MIRTILASPWSPLSYWVAALIAVTLVAHHKSLKLIRDKQDPKTIVSIPVRVPALVDLTSSIPQERPDARITPAMPRLATYWYPGTSVLRPPELFPERSQQEFAKNETLTSRDVQPLGSPPMTTLCIRADTIPSGSNVAKTLLIQCRTYAPISNSRRRNVTIHGVVTQDVVSSSGKILIMAGSRVTGGAFLDPENARLKSEGSWSVFTDNTEIKVQARLMDGAAGMPGILGQETSEEDEALRTEAVVRDGRYVFVPEKAPFTLEVYGDITFRDAN
ncbi:MAG: hypothetical protein JO070_10745 [Verrucomicrobia bacterium]|nr:hypothetical protein [Verrucomicrobiota bacterium]